MSPPPSPCLAGLRATRSDDIFSFFGKGFCFGLEEGKGRESE